MRRIVAILLCLQLSLPAALPAQACPAGPVALVLSGGGAKGYAHLGVLRALDSMGIRPALVVGTSMGAIMGAMYASGYSARAIDSIVAALAFDDLFRRPGPRVPRAWGDLLPLAMWEQGDRGFFLQNPAVREAEANAFLGSVLLRGNLFARGDFDRMPIRFRAVATDLANRTTVVLSGGDLAQAVRASIAIPLVFTPVRLGGRVLIDGGLSANVPVAIARGLGAARIIVSDVTERFAGTVSAENPLAVADQLMNFLFTQPLDSLGPADAYIRPAVTTYRSLDFRRSTLAELEEAGRRAADTTLSRAACFPPPPARDEPAFPATIAGVTVNGGSAQDQALLRRIVGLADGALDPELLSRRILALREGDPFEEVWLTPGGSGDSVRFDAEIHRASRRLAGAGVAYDSDLSGRFWAGALERRFPGLGMEASLLLGIGRYRDDATLALRHTGGGGGLTTTPFARLFLGRENVRQFDPEGREAAALGTRQGRLTVGVEQRIGRTWRLEAGALGVTWRSPDRSTATAAGVVFRADRQPDGGSRTHSAEATWTGRWRKAAIALSQRIELGAITLTPVARVGWGAHLPEQETFALGGESLGFPGIRFGERRGDREAMGAVQGTWAVKGPLSLRLLVAAGRSGRHGPLLAEDGWLTGARGGLGVESPLGPFALEYGVASDGSGVVYFRAGRWF